jgi:zinc/manganese transport system substrate-binding protein
MRIVLNKKIIVLGLALGGAFPALARTTVVASISILGDWARAVAGPDADVKVLIGPDGNPHAYEPAFPDAVAVSRADVLLMVGNGFEPCMDRLLSTAGGRARVVRAAAGLSASDDPHVWGDVVLVRRAVEGLRDALAGADPAHAGATRLRAEAYSSKLSELDDWTRALVARLPPERRVLVTNHDTLGRWAARYGFRVEGTLFSSSGLEAEDLSASRMAELAARLRALNVPAVFVENMAADRAARALAVAAGVKVAPALYTDALGAPGTPGDTYIGMMKYDARVIVEALK